MTLALAAFGLGWTAPRAAADGLGDPGTTEASFADAHLKDDLAGTLADPAKEIRIGFHATVASKLTTTLDADSRALAQLGTAGATGLTLTLCTSDGTPVVVAGTKHDVSNATQVRWRAFPLPATGDYVLIVRAATAGSWRLRLAGSLASVRVSEFADDLPQATERELAFDGLAGGKLTWSLTKAGRSSKFAGQAVRIVQPDDTELPGVTEAASGTVPLLQNGPHRFVYRNGGTTTGDGNAELSMRAPKVVKRTVFVRAAGAAFVPVVTKVEPSRAFHKQEALGLTIRGRDFQPGADVRLVRSGRDDVIATSVEVTDTEITCFVDIDTLDTTGESSIGSWTVGVWNAPEYAVEGDPTSLVKESPTRSLKKRFTSLSAASIALPAGTVKGTEVWFVDFNQDFQQDLDAMGLSSNDPNVRARAKILVQAYVILHLRDLFGTNETLGTLKKSGSVPVSFIVTRPPAVSGAAGVDYNRIEVGGAQQQGDVHDPAEPLAWGASGLAGAEIDFGNVRRDDLGIFDAADVRVGLGARTAVLDPTDPNAAQGWTQAMAPLRSRPLTANDLNVFSTNFVPANQAQADRYAEIVTQSTRAAREIAAIIAHHVGKAMGLEDGVASGPMTNPTKAGEMWPQLASLAFPANEMTTLRAAAVPHQLPGRAGQLRITWFPLQPGKLTLPDCVTPVSYIAPFGFVGGRPNARPGDYRVQYVLGSLYPPPQLQLSFTGLSGIVPVSQDGNVANYMCYSAVFRIAVTDTVRGGTRFFRYRLDTYPDVTHPGFPGPLVPAAQACINNLPPKPAQ